MSIITRTVLNQRELLADGTIQVRIAKQVVNGEITISSEWHRVALPPGCDLEASIAAVDEHLETMGYAPLHASDWDKVRANASAEWTPEVIEAFAAKVAAERPPQEEAASE